MSIYDFPARKRHMMGVIRPDGQRATMVFGPAMMKALLDMEAEAKRERVVLFLR